MIHIRYYDGTRVTFTEDEWTKECARVRAQVEELRKGSPFYPLTEEKQ